MPVSAQRRPARVLIYRLGSLGDTLVALPVFHLAARAFPEAERRLLTNIPVSAKAPAAAAILDNAGLIHGYFRYIVGTRSLRDLVRLWWELVRWRPEVLLYAGPSRGVSSARRDALFFRLCGIRRQIGVPVTADMQNPRRETHQGREAGYEPEASRLVRNLAVLGEAGLDDPASWSLHLTAAEHAKAFAALAPAAGLPLIALSLGTKSQANDWGNEKWRALLARIAALYPNHALALLGASGDSGNSEFAAGGWRENSSSPVLNLCGLLTPRESAAVLSRSVVFLGHDSGPMHLAASVQTTCVAVFSARNLPRIWYPWGDRHRIVRHRIDCEGCRLDVCIARKKECTTSISVDEVLVQVVGVLPAPSGHIEVQ